MKKEQVIIFTDGSSRGNPGPGGFGVVVVDNGTVRELGGGEGNTTNNRMEMMAAIAGLSSVPGQSEVIIYTDSSYLINGATKWINGWKRNGWKTKMKEDVLNKDLWLKLDESAKGKKVTWKYIGGHSGVVGNERCDHIATSFADHMKIELYDGPSSGYDLPNILDLSYDKAKVALKRASSGRSSMRAYSYISMVGGLIEVHHSWADCEKRVKGVRGARFRKSLNTDDERRIIEEFGTL